MSAEAKREIKVLLERIGEVLPREVTERINDAILKEGDVSLEELEDILDELRGWASILETPSEDVFRLSCLVRQMIEQELSYAN